MKVEDFKVGSIYRIIDNNSDVIVKCESITDLNGYSHANFTVIMASSAEGKDHFTSFLIGGYYGMMDHDCKIDKIEEL